MEEKKIVETLFVRRSVNVSEQDIDDILCTAFEGGITYWCDSVRDRWKLPWKICKRSNQQRRKTEISCGRTVRQ